MAQLVWFRSDLRVTDNRALNAALFAAKQQDTKVFALFIASRGQWQQHNMGLPKRDFLARSLLSLSEKLHALGVSLRVIPAPFFSDIPTVLTGFITEHGITQVHAQGEFGWDERQRDAAVSKALAGLGVVFSLNQDRCLVDPDAVLTQGASPYKVFTAFKRNWLSQLTENWRPPKSFSSVKPKKSVLATNALLDVSGLYNADETPESIASIAKLWPGHEVEASRRLKVFLSDNVKQYQSARDFPAQAGTSSLSPYLAAGVISPRQCVAAWLNAAEGDWYHPVMQSWLNELAWRDFYHYVMWHFPKVSKDKPFQDKTQSVLWRHAPKDFSAWCEGKTGVPIVDAAMAQLNNTGWMHNRLRMVVASYLSKNLFIDWRLGEAYFMEKLVDADFPANNGGWQWSASTGTDAAPYFRVFNPVSQSQRFDADGVFIKQWLPELSHLNAKQIHDPAEALRGSYPASLVDLKLSRRMAIDAFARL